MGAVAPVVLKDALAQLIKEHKLDGSRSDIDSGMESLHEKSPANRNTVTRKKRRTVEHIDIYSTVFKQKTEQKVNRGTAYHQSSVIKEIIGLFRCNL